MAQGAQILRVGRIYRILNDSTVVFLRIITKPRGKLSDALRHTKRTEHPAEARRGENRKLIAASGGEVAVDADAVQTRLSPYFPILSFPVCSFQRKFQVANAGKKPYKAKIILRPK